MPSFTIPCLYPHSPIDNSNTNIFVCLQVWVKDLHPTPICKDSQKGAYAFSKDPIKFPTYERHNFYQKTKNSRFPAGVLW